MRFNSRVSLRLSSTLCLFNCLSMDSSALPAETALDALAPRGRACRHYRSKR